VGTNVTLVTMQSALGRWGCPRTGKAWIGLVQRFWVALATAAIPSIGGLSVAHAQTPPGPAYPSAPYPYAAPTPTPLEAGGLRPPSSTTPSPAASESETLRQLERAEHEDAGRGLEFFWVDVEGGYEYLSLQGFRSNALLDGDAVADAGSGYALGVGAGVRLIFVTLGGRFRLARASDWDLYTLDAEVGLHLPFGALEPSFTFAAGYAALGSPSAEGSSGFDAGLVDVSGVNARLGANLDYYVNPLLSFGARGSFEALALWRGGAEQPAAVPAGTAATYARDGDGVGFGLTLSAALGLHF
jgi:hypothetical protein